MTHRSRTKVADEAVFFFVCIIHPYWRASNYFSDTEAYSAFNYLSAYLFTRQRERQRKRREDMWLFRRNKTIFRTISGTLRYKHLTRVVGTFDRFEERSDDKVQSLTREKQKAEKKRRNGNKGRSRFLVK